MTESRQQPDGHLPEMQHAEDQISAMLGMFVDRLADPAPNARNKKHFVIGSGSEERVVLKAAPWLSPITGEKVSAAPEWVALLPSSPDIARADFVENLPDPENPEVYLNEAHPNSAFNLVSRHFVPDTSEHNDGGFFLPDDKKRPEMQVRLVRNPLTGEEKFKSVPWIESSTGTFILEEYRSNLEVSRGGKVVIEGVEHEDPNDIDNLRFFNRDFIIHFRRWGLQDEVFRYDKAHGAADPMARAGNPGWLDNNRQLCWREQMVVALNLGGTIMSEETDEGIKPTLSYRKLYNDHLRAKFPDTTSLITMAPLSKVTKDSEATNGIDSSQMEIDFLADIAILMTNTWNSLISSDREKFEGFVVPVGSDSCVQSLCYLKSMLGPECPFSVIFVPAMRPIFDPQSEGMESLTSAYEMLHELHEDGRVVQGIRAGGGFFDPTKTLKTDDSKAEAFEGKKLFDPTVGEKIADVKDRFSKRDPAAIKNKYESAFIMRGTDQTKYLKADALSQDPFQLEYEVANSEAKAFFVGTFPSFTTAINLMKAISRGAKGRPVFYINSVVGAQPHGYEINELLRKNGVHVLTMTAPMAQAKLNYALRMFPHDNEKVVDFMTRNNFIGEQPEGFVPPELPASPDTIADGVKNRVASVGLPIRWEGRKMH